jgi:PAS domain S-box-containing protein
MDTEHSSTDNIVTRLTDSIRSSFRIRMLILTVGGVLLSVLLSSLIFVLGMNKLTKDTSVEIEYGLGVASQQHLERQIKGTAARINLWMGHAQADLCILADITQQLIDHRDEFLPMTEILTEIPFFADRMQYYPEGGYSQNAPDEPSVVTIQTIYHDENAQIKPYPQQIIAETALLDLIMPAIHTWGAEKMWSYFAGGTDAGFLRLTPWTDFGKEATENYPEQMNVSYWVWFPGLVEAWEKWLENPDSTQERATDVVTFRPSIDATSGQIIQIFGHPLWNSDRTRFAGAVWYDLELAEVTDIIEQMELTETGFAFLAQDDGNVIAIPERGTQVMGLQERIVGDGNLLRSLEESRERDVATLTLPQDDVVSFLEVQLAGEEYTLVMHRLAPMNMFLDGEEQTTVQYWTLGFVVPKDEIRAPLMAAQANVARSLESILMLQAVILTVLVVLLIGLVFTFSGRMTRGLANLSTGASQVAQGNLGARVEVLSTDEIGKLGKAFNGMARQLEESFDRIEQRNIQLENETLERQQAELERGQSEERLRQVVEHMPVMMSAFDAEGNILIWNKECERITGYSAEEMISKPGAMERLHPDPTYREQMIARWAERGNDYYDWEQELVAKDGTVKTVAWSSISDRLPIPGWSAWGTGVDITERKQTEQALRESEQEYRLLAETTSDLILLHSTDGSITYLNQAGLDLIGFEQSDAIGRSIADLVPAEHRADLLAREAQHAEGDERTYLYETELLSRAGHRIPIEVNSTPVLHAGRVSGILIVGRDITQRKRTEEELRKSREHLEETVAERTAELRKMVNAMAGREVRMAELKEVIRQLRAQLQDRADIGG